METREFSVFDVAPQAKSRQSHFEHGFFRDLVGFELSVFLIGEAEPTRGILEWADQAAFCVHIPAVLNSIPSRKDGLDGKSVLIYKHAVRKIVSH